MRRLSLDATSTVSSSPSRPWRFGCDGRWLQCHVPRLWRGSCRTCVRLAPGSVHQSSERLQTGSQEPSVHGHQPYPIPGPSAPKRPPRSSPRHPATRCQRPRWTESPMHLTQLIHLVSIEDGLVGELCLVSLLFHLQQNSTKPASTTTSKSAPARRWQKKIETRGWIKIPLDPSSRGVANKKHPDLDSKNLLRVFVHDRNFWFVGPSYNQFFNKNRNIMKHPLSTTDFAWLLYIEPITCVCCLFCCYRLKQPLESTAGRLSSSAKRWSSEPSGTVRRRSAKAVRRSTAVRFPDFTVAAAKKQPTAGIWKEFEMPKITNSNKNGLSTSKLAP